MYSSEIDRLLKIRQYLISCSEYFEILSTSPQIQKVKYNPDKDSFYIETTDNYNFDFRISFDKGRKR